jgi:nicotinamide riboside transporter PnuC
METKSKNWFKKLGWIGIVACGVCCALPIIGTVAGIGVLTALGAYFEKIAIVVLGIAAILFTIYFYQKKKTEKKCDTSCDTSCECTTETSTE